MRIIFLMKIRVDGGYINYNPSTDNGEYCYYIQDHIGNNRVILSETRGVIQYADYYPYGIPFSDIPMEEDNFLHADKELKKMHGLRWVYIEYPIDSPSGINVLFASSPLGLM
ncbi:hypothetical protein K8P02_11840 [Bacteroides nordii]|uniref:hypothetical protein n=1 Tax=Bacteroides nordii TaxID=291645 RepID=UPI0012DD7617|nr:hypothetical protein [Bacteroides nordii]UAK40914.1 hypothetical protein K8P02_11840 [Bacteroides nordii]